MLETGEDEHDNPLTRWGYFFPSTFYSHLYRNFFTMPEPHVNNRRLYHMSTKALGGGTAVNAMVWTWGDQRDWDMVQVPGTSRQQKSPRGRRGRGKVGRSSISHAGLNDTCLRGRGPGYCASLMDAPPTPPPPLTGWTYQDILPYFNRSETYTGIDTTGLRGKEGPTVISSFEPNDVSDGRRRVGDVIPPLPLSLYSR